MVKVADTEALIRELIESLKNEERDLRKRNDDLRKENRDFLTANKGWQKKNEDISVQISSQRTILRNLEAGINEINAEIRQKEVNANKRIQNAEDSEEVLNEIARKNADGILKLLKIKDEIAAGHASLKKKRITLNEDEDRVNQQKKDYEKLLNEVEVEKDKTTQLVAQKIEALKKSEEDKVKIAETLKEAEEIKKQILAREQELKQAKDNTVALNCEIDVKKRQFAVLLEETEKKKKDLGVQIDKCKAKQKGLNRENKELDIKKQEIETENLKVQKIIRDKKIAKDLVALKKDLG